MSWGRLRQLEGQALRALGGVGAWAGVLMVVGVLTLGLNASNSQGKAPSAEAVLAHAMSVHDAAMARDHAWVTTRRALARAQDLLDAGDESASLLAAQQALQSAQASLNQADVEAESWPARVPT